MAEKTVCTSECENCTHCTLEEISKSKIYINCDIKNKKFMYGQFVPCDDFNKRKVN